MVAAGAVQKSAAQQPASPKKNAARDPAPPYERGTSAKDRANKILEDGARSKDQAVRLQAVIATSMVGSDAAVSHRLEELLQDREVSVRLASVNALADLKSKSSIPALREVLRNDKVPEVAFAAAKALYVLDDNEGSVELYDIFDRRVSGQSSVIRKQARDFFDKFHTVKSSMMLVLSEGVGFVPVPGAGEGLTAITELSSDPELTTRATIVLLMGKKKTKEADDLLRRAVSDKDWAVRAAAAQTIASAAKLPLQGELLTLLDDEKAKVRFRAAGAYLHLNVLGEKELK